MRQSDLFTAVSGGRCPMWETVDMSELSPQIDFKRVFEASPDCYLLLRSDPPRFTILAVSDAYAQATNTIRENIIGKGIFEVFPDNPDDPNASGVKNLTASLLRAIEHRKMDTMATQKYDIPRPDEPGAGFEERYWSPDNSPVFDEEGTVIYLIHHVADVTQHQKLIQAYGTMETKVRDTNTELDQKTIKAKELEKLNEAMLGREIKMAELKKENEELKKKLGT